MEIAELVGAFVGGGALQALINYFISKNKSKRDDFDKIISTWSQDNDRLRNKINADEDRIRALEIEINLLRNQVMLLESAHQDLPIPMWLKDVECKMLVVNASYEDVFLTPRGYSAADYIGKDDHAVWPKALADAFVKNDRHVLKSKQTWIGVEKVEDETGNIGEWKIIKYPRYSGRTIIGIAGIAVPTVSI